MSDLAPFVAATIRDKVVEDLIEENKRLREQLEETRTVEITGPCGSPIYAGGNFANGKYGGNLWDVPLSRNTEPISISALADLEVQFGGVVYAMAVEGVQACMDENELDGGNQKVVGCHFGDSERGVWVIMLIKGWPKNSWSELQRTWQSREEEVNAFDVICNSIAMLYPDATVLFTELYFFRSGVKKAIEHLKLDPSVEQAREQHLEASQFTGTLALRMRDAGYPGPGLIPCLRELEEVLYGFGIFSLDDDDFEIVVERLMELQLRTRDNFQESLRRHLHEITRGTNIRNAQIH